MTDETIQDYLAELTACVNSFLPVFVYTVAPGDRITKASLQKRIDACSAIDDVFNLSFLEHIVFFGSSKDKVSLDKDAIEFLNSEKFGAWTFIQDDGSASALAAGPYVVGRNMTWQPWRIYTDTYDTLMTSFRPGYTSTSGLVSPRKSALEHSQSNNMIEQWSTGQPTRVPRSLLLFRPAATFRSLMKGPWMVCGSLSRTSLTLPVQRTL